MRLTGWRQPLPKALASKVFTSRRVLRMVGFNRNFPRGGSAKGIPTNVSETVLDERRNHTSKELQAKTSDV